MNFKEKQAYANTLDFKGRAAYIDRQIDEIEWKFTGISMILFSLLAFVASILAYVAWNMYILFCLEHYETLHPKTQLV